LKPNFTMENTEKKYLKLLLFILLVAAALRFWDFWNIPFMHDELSAMSRLTFQNISDLIKYGVVLNDTHPAGVQVFMYYWVMLVGEREVWVKLPFLLSGLASVFLVFKIGNLWFDRTTGLISAAMVATLQFFIMYGQIARPYTSGLFFTLVMVYYWSKYFFVAPKIRYLFVFSVFGGLSAYNHHFSLLFAALVGLSGVFFVKKNQLIQYALAGLGIFVLYIPHLPIFFHQLEQGGIGGVGGWLAKPTPGFFADFFSWLIHFSFIGGGVLALVLVFLLFRKGRFQSYDFPFRKRVVLILWFALPLVIGYIYSIRVNPILQFSLLIFGTPYLFMLVFSFHKKLDLKALWGVVLVLMTVNIGTLVFERDYYRIFYRQPYNELFKAAVREQNKGDVFIIDNIIPYIHGYYFRKYGVEIPYFTKRNKELALSDFNRKVASIVQSRVVTQGLTGEELQLVRSYFPYQVSYDCGFTYETYVLSKRPEDKTKPTCRLLASYSADSTPGKFNVKPELKVFDTLTGKPRLRMTEQTEWGFSADLIFDSLQIDPGEVVDAQIYVEASDQVGGAVLAGYITRAGEVVYWTSAPFQRFVFKPGEEIGVFLTIDLSGALKKNFDTKDLILHYKVWNNHKQGNFYIDSMKVFERPGNPEKYTLYYR